MVASFEFREFRIPQSEFPLPPNPTSSISDHTSNIRFPLSAGLINMANLAMLATYLVVGGRRTGVRGRGSGFRVQSSEVGCHSAIRNPNSAIRIPQSNGPPLLTKTSERPHCSDRQKDFSNYFWPPRMTLAKAQRRGGRRREGGGQRSGFRNQQSQIRNLKSAFLHPPSKETGCRPSETHGATFQNFCGCFTPTTVQR